MREASAQFVEVGQAPGVERAFDRRGEIGLAAALVGEDEQADHRAAGLALGPADDQGVPGPGEGGTRPGGVAVGEADEGAGLGAQRVQHVAVVDHVDAPPVRARAPPRQGQQVRAPEVGLEPFLVDPQPQAPADQAGRDGVEDAAEGEAAAAGHQHARLGVVRRAPGRQRAEGGALEFDLAAAPGVLLGHHLGDEGAVGREALEVPPAAQQQRLVEARLDVGVAALDGAVPVRLAAGVARRDHAVVPAQRRIAAGGVLGRIRREVAEGRRQAVGAVLDRRPAQGGERVPQPGRERGEALAAEDDLGVLEAREGEREVVEPVGQRRARDRHAEVGRVGEVRQAQPPRRVGLREHDFPLRPVDRPPVAHPAFQGAPDALAVGAGEGAVELVQHRHGLEARRPLQQGHDEALPDQRQRVLARAPVPRLPPLRARPGVALDPARGGDRDARAGGGDGLRGGPAFVHVEPHLLIRDVSARHRPSRDPGKGGSLTRTRRRARPAARLRAGYAHPPPRRRALNVVVADRSP